MGDEILTEVSSTPLWWPPAKVAGGRLPAWLAAAAARAATAGAAGPAGQRGA